jgi:sterol desaturase/sphingolipid hydroxylase (fatty acid hydroxylase superfamily)
VVCGDRVNVGVFFWVRSAAFVLASAVAWGLQRLSPHAGSTGSLGVNLPLFAVGAAATAAICGSCALAVAAWAETEAIGLLHHLRLASGLETLFVVAFLDLLSYAWHRANHSWSLLWRFHQVHHSDGEFTVSTGVRFHPGELLLSVPVRLAGIIAVGATPVQVLVFESLFAIANLVEHGDIDLPPALERAAGRVLVLPAHHRRHHSRDGDDLKRNFGTIFIVWDRMLATFRASASYDRVDVGLPGEVECRTLSDALRLPLRALPGLRQ